MKETTMILTRINPIPLTFDDGTTELIPASAYFSIAMHAINLISPPANTNNLTLTYYFTPAGYAAIYPELAYEMKGRQLTDLTPHLTVITLDEAVNTFTDIFYADDYQVVFVV